MPSSIHGNTGPRPINRIAGPDHSQTPEHAATGETVGRLAGRTVCQVSAGADQGGKDLHAIHSALDRLNAAGAEPVVGPRLSSRTAMTAENSPRQRQADAFSLRLAASARAGGALFNAAVQGAGLQPDLMSDAQRTAIDASTAGIDVAHCPQDFAGTILRVAVGAAARFILRAGADGGEPSVVRAAVATEVVNLAAGAMADGNPVQAARWLAEGARALDAAPLDADAVAASLRSALEEAPRTAMPAGDTSNRLTKMVDNPHLLRQIERHCQSFKL